VMEGFRSRAGAADDFLGNYCANHTPHLLHRNDAGCTETSLSCTEMTFVAQKRTLLHRNDACCTERTSQAPERVA
jgi:hypothetical protein